MKRTVTALMILAALAACTKSETQYESPGEIDFAPATKNITRAAVEGNMPTDHNLVVWAYWNGKDGSSTAAEKANPTIPNYTQKYLTNAEFTNREGTANWGGATEKYPWPANGALIFAGYNKPQGTVQYTAVFSGLTGDDDNFDDTGANTFVFQGYTDLTNSFDLCWFGATATSYDKTSGVVPVTLSHALTWITINIKGDATTAPSGEGAKPWIVTKATLKAANTVGTHGVCTINSQGKGTAVWTSTSLNNGGDDIVVKAAEQSMTTGSVKYNDIVVIPQAPVYLEVEYKYPVSGAYLDGKSIVNLTLDNHKDEAGNPITDKITEWQSGVHYTYTLVFKANEIQVAPSFGEWTDSPHNVTVE